ncbi:MAG: hypothetical protein DI547_09590 [Sphingobium sp.]|jgi:hypothetical protein|nr:MAG: hypothetical protein DI547_09590 [Sphingobium sp.]
MRLMPDLPADARAELRYRCGFGCVRCGVTIYQYLALPIVRDRKADDPPEPTMMCPTCHRLVEEERLTPSQVHVFHANPVARQRHFSRDRLPFSNDLPELAVGGSRAVRDTPIPLALEGEPLLLFAPPRQGVGATRISVRLGSGNGEAAQIIDGNEWLITDGSWSFAYRGDRYFVTEARGDGLAVLRIVQRNRIAVEHLRTNLRGRRIEATPDWVEVDGRRFVDRVSSGVLVGLDL